MKVTAEMVREIIEKKDIIVEFQPIYSLNTKKYSHYYTFSLYKTDDASSINRVFVGKNRLAGIPFGSIIKPIQNRSFHISIPNFINIIPP